GASLEPGRATEAKAVERGGQEATGSVAVAAVGEPEESGVAGAVGSTGSVDWRAGRCGGRTGQHPTSSAAINDASGSGADHRAGVRANHGTGATLSPRQTGGQLSRADSHGAFQRRSWAAAGTHQQAGESVFARVAGGSSAKCGAARTLVARKKKILLAEEKTLQKKCAEKFALTEPTSL